VIKHYVEFFYPGSFVSETSRKPVPERDVPVDLPAGAYGYRFLSRSEVEHDGETLIGKDRNVGPMTYVGEILTVADIKALNDGRDYYTLLANMRINRWDRVVRTVRGNFQQLNDGDKVVAAHTTGEKP
jgi:hypothetical protein